MILYEDSFLSVIIPKKALNKSHIRVVPKKAVKAITDLAPKEQEHLWYTASFCGSVLFEVFSAQGTNLIALDGKDVGIDVVAQTDKVDFSWKPKELTEEQMKKAQGSIKDRCDYIGVKPPKKVLEFNTQVIEDSSVHKPDVVAEKKVVTEEKKEADETTKTKKEPTQKNYLLDQLKRRA